MNTSTTNERALPKESLPIMNNAFLETFNGSGYIVKRERTYLLTNTLPLFNGSGLVVETALADLYLLQRRLIKIT